MNEVDRYIKKIHSTLKRVYAERYLEWVMAGRGRFQPESPGLSVMAAQAVRMRINNYLEVSNVPH